MKTAVLNNRKISPFDIKEVGAVREVKKVIAKVDGLPSCIYGQLVTFNSAESSDEAKGMVIGFDEKEVLVLLLGDETLVRSGDKVYSNINTLRVPVGKNFIGRVVNGLAEPIDGEGRISPDDFYHIFKDPPGVMDRIPLTAALHTGIKIIDSMIPLAKGQRELIIGDRMTGKTTLAIDTILNQRDKDVVCIYCCIGKSLVSLTNIIKLLRDKGALDYTFIVAATAAFGVGDQYLVPYTAAALGEYFMNMGRDVLVVFDDFTRHAWNWRQLSLLLERSPGREAYPGDMFYTHSQLVERACRLTEEKGGGSMSFLPIVETQQGDVTGHIPSNLISMTDGQIYMSTSIFQEGFKPAIDFGLSVSRIGNKVQCPAMREVSSMLRLEYVQYKELLRLTRMRTRLSKSAEKILRRGEVMTRLLSQDKHCPVSLEEELIFLYALKRNVLEILPEEGYKKFEAGIMDYLRKTNSDILQTMVSDKGLTPNVKAALDKAFVEFFKREKIL